MLRRAPLRWALALALSFAYGWWAVSLAPFSAGASVAVLAGGLAAVLVGTRRRSPPTTAGGKPGVGWWAGLAMVAAVWQLAAYLQGPRADHPTLSVLLNTALDTHWARAAAFVLWMAVTVELARR